MDNKHCIVELLIKKKEKKKRQQPVDMWPVTSGHVVCVQKDLLYFHLEKNKTS